MSSPLLYPLPIERAISKIESLLENRTDAISSRSIALLLLQQDATWKARLQNEPYFPEIEKIITETQAKFSDSLGLEIAQSRHQQAMAIAEEVTTHNTKKQAVKQEWLHQLTTHPLTGIPILFLVLYFGIYQFVGVFGGGILVDGIEGFFESQINPVVNTIIATIFPWQVLQDLLANEYGIITLGMRYAIAIVLPVVATFFLMFSLLEDSGYLPRLSLLVDRLFKTIGLSGRSIIPLILGLGCGTMATLVTRCSPPLPRTCSLIGLGVSDDGNLFRHWFLSRKSGSRTSLVFLHGNSPVKSSPLTSNSYQNLRQIEMVFLGNFTLIYRCFGFNLDGPTHRFI
jgi:ferrous iron transport protein B